MVASEDGAGKIEPGHGQPASEGQGAHGVPRATAPERTAASTGWVRRRWHAFLGLGPPDFRDPRLGNADIPEPSPEQVRYAEMIARQIEVEQGLAGTRMAWNLTFQGFTIAAYAVVAASGGTAPSKNILETAIALSSGLIAFVTMRGIVASQAQREYLKASWAAKELTRYFPEPFSISATSSRGRLPAYAICLVLMAMWLLLLGTQFSWSDRQPLRVSIE